MTLRDQLIASLKQIGETKLPSTSRCYVKMSRKMHPYTGAPLPVDKHSFYWIGSNGALRVGRTVTDSISITDSKLYMHLLVKAAPSNLLAELD